MGTKPLLLDLLDPRARRSVGPELAFPAGSTVSRGKAKGGCDPTPAGEGGGERRDLDKLSVPYSLNSQLVLDQRASYSLAKDNLSCCS